MAIATGALIAAGIGAAASAYGAHKQSSSQNKATKAQQQANQEAVTYEQQRQAGAKRQAKSRWDDYTKRLELYYRNNPNAVQRYGYLPGYKSEWSTPAAGAPGSAPGGVSQSPVTLAGGRQVSGGDYDAYVKAREARRAGAQPGTLGSMFGPKPAGIQT